MLDTRVALEKVLLDALFQVAVDVSQAVPVGLIIYTSTYGLLV